MGILLSDNEEHIFILGVQAFQEYTKDLIDIIGPKVVKELFYRGGLNAGRYELRKIKALIQSEDMGWNLLN